MSDTSVDACRRKSRMMSIIGAIVVGLVVWVLFSFWIGLILGVVTYCGLSWFLGRSCAEAHTPAAVTTPPAPKPSPVTTAPAATTTETPSKAPVTADATPPADGAETKTAVSTAVKTTAHWSSSVNAESGKASTARGQSALKPSVELTEEATLRDGVGAWVYKGEGADVNAAPAPAAEAVPVVEAVADPVPAVSAGEEQPTTLSAARAEGADDLKRIKGVGPGLEKTLNELGFYHFDQIAAWTGAEVEWVDSRLKFKGRIVRDNWIDQAKAFAESA